MRETCKEGEGEEQASGHTALFLADRPGDSLTRRPGNGRGVKSSFVAAIPLPDFPLSTFQRIQIPASNEDSSNSVGFCPIRKLGESRGRDSLARTGGRAPISCLSFVRGEEPFQVPKCIYYCGQVRGDPLVREVIQHAHCTALGVTRRKKEAR